MAVGDEEGINVDHNISHVPTNLSNDQDFLRDKPINPEDKFRPWMVMNKGKRVSKPKNARRNSVYQGKTLLVLSGHTKTEEDKVVSSTVEAHPLMQSHGVIKGVKKPNGKKK